MGTIESATGRDLLSMFATAERHLERCAEHVNSINVFPVADGDTGTNLLRTLQAALRAAGPGSGSPTAAAVSAAMSRGALEGARGNSGVILSQFFRGMASVLEGKETCSGEDLELWFGRADEFARGGMEDAVEGTMLTALTDCTEALRRDVDGARSPFSSALGVAVRAARESVARSPSLLGVLRERGVVDAGAEGFLRLLEGAEQAALGAADLPPRVVLSGGQGEDESTRAASGGPGTGTFCVGLLLEGAGASPGEIRARLAREGTSLIVAGDAGALRIHVHTAHPEQVVAYARSQGTVTRVDRHELPLPAPRGQRYGILAVATGEGFADAFESMGAGALVPASVTGVPGMEEILEGVNAFAAEQVILLPNGREALAAAREAARRSPRAVTVIPTLTVPQGIAALIALRFDADLAENAALMERAAHSVRTIEIAWDGGIVAGRLDDGPAAAWNDPVRAVQDLVRRIDTASTDTVTVYSGGSVDASRVEEARRALADAMPHADIQAVRAGPDRACLIISIE